MRFHLQRLLAVCASLAMALIYWPYPTAKTQSTELAATPPMGWNSWNHFAEHVTDADVRAAADAIVASGMKDAGYIYVNVDDSWEGQRDAQGNIHSNNRFPDMKALGDYVHSKTLWAILAAPLLAGNDLSKMDDTTKSILTNKEVIAVDQDKLGIQGSRIGAPQIWMKRLSDGSKAVALFNFVVDDEAEPVTLKFIDVGFSGPVHVRDLWANKDLGVLHDSYTVTVPQGGVVMLRMSQ